VETRQLAELGAEPEPAVAVVGCAVSQEEIGLFGSATTSFSLSPDIGIAVDVTHATDAPGISKQENGDHALGSGPVIGRGSTLNHIVADLLRDAAEAEGIDHTLEASGRYTGTDADSIQISKGGIAAGLVSIPLRYMHSSVEMVDLADVEATIKLLTAFAAATATPIHILHLIGLILVMGMGVDYGIFVWDSAGDVEETEATMQSLLLSALTTIFVFGVMGLSSHPVLHAIGRTTALGIALAFVLAPASLVLVGRRPVPRSP